MDSRDFIFYVAVGYYKLGEFEKALKYVKRLLAIEPNNHQAKDLEQSIEKKLKNDGMIGMAMVGGAAALLAGALFGALALKKK